MRTLFALLFVTMLPNCACAHGGGLNADGCHTNRKTGDYHCHRAQPARVIESPAASAPLYAAPPATQSAVTSRSKASATARTTPYRNCTEARAAGAAPVKRTDPGYGTHLDRDGDGVGCE